MDPSQVTAGSWLEKFSKTTDQKIPCFDAKTQQKSLAKIYCCEGWRKLCQETASDHFETLVRELFDIDRSKTDLLHHV